MLIDVKGDKAVDAPWSACSQASKMKSCASRCLMLVDVLLLELTAVPSRQCAYVMSCVRAQHGVVLMSQSLIEAKISTKSFAHF
jgi:hypothetical protein